MPNGGSDCCGTCCFFRGEIDRGKCLIRDLDVVVPMYTYCANHPRRNPTRISVPLGPAFAGSARELWKLAPDTEEARQALLQLLSAMKETPAEEYPVGYYLDDLVIWQLGEFREVRAVEHLQRITAFNPAANAPGPFPRDRRGTVEVARRALAKIREEQPVDYASEPEGFVHPHLRPAPGRLEDQPALETGQQAVVRKRWWQFWR